MAHILLIKRSKADGKLYALCHRRGRPIREAYHWGIPGGAFDREERHLLQSSEVDREIKLQVCRRAAIREAIEESGGGEHELLPPQPIVGVGAVMDGHTHTIYLKEVEFRDVTIPPGLLNITDNTDNTRLMSARYGSAKDKKTNVFVYVLDPHLDAAYFSNWSPRALLPYRKEIDEDYVKANCKYGQLW